MFLMILHDFSKKIIKEVTTSPPHALYIKRFTTNQFFYEKVIFYQKLRKEVTQSPPQALFTNKHFESPKLTEMTCVPKERSSKAKTKPIEAIDKQ